MSLLKNKHIILGVTGGVAAYKSLELARKLIEQGAKLQVVLTQAAREFVTPLSFQALTGSRVREDLFDREAEAAMGHIELARWADLVLVAPTSADFMATLAHGFAGNLLATLCLATKANIALVPAMNTVMWQAAATQANLALLKQRGMTIIGPVSGLQACNEVGIGRMMEPVDIVTEVERLFTVGTLTGKRVLITAGPTQEAIDPVRFITNRSSGKMGFALADAAAAAGAEVTLVTGHVNLATPAGVKRIDVVTAEDMYNAVMRYISGQTIFIACAAVADYRMREMINDKLSSDAPTLTLELIRNPDILASVTALKLPLYTVGFAAQTSDLINKAKQKLLKKQCNMLVANHVGEGKGFNVDENAFSIFYADTQLEWSVAPKRTLAKNLISLIAEQMR